MLKKLSHLFRTEKKLHFQHAFDQIQQVQTQNFRISAPKASPSPLFNFGK